MYACVWVCNEEVKERMVYLFTLYISIPSRALLLLNVWRECATYLSGCLNLIEVKRFFVETKFETLMKVHNVMVNICGSTKWSHYVWHPLVRVVLVL